MSAKREKIEEKQLQGFKYYQMISPLLQRLHGAGCARDRAGNRDLYMDQYMSLILLYLFNPICFVISPVCKNRIPSKQGWLHLTTAPAYAAPK